MADTDMKQIKQTIYRVLNYYLENDHEWDRSDHISKQELNIILDNCEDEVAKTAKDWDKFNNAAAYHAIISSYVKQFHAWNPVHPLTLSVDENGTLWIKPTYTHTVYPKIE